MTAPSGLQSPATAQLRALCPACGAELVVTVVGDEITAEGCRHAFHAVNRRAFRSRVMRAAGVGGSVDNFMVDRIG